MISEGSHDPEDWSNDAETLFLNAWIWLADKGFKVYNYFQGNARQTVFQFTNDFDILKVLTEYNSKITKTHKVNDQANQYSKQSQIISMFLPQS